jgi:hypothetical protein
VQHARAGRRDVLTEEENALGLCKVVKCAGADRTPMLSGSATDVVSWHMLELSGKLLLP